MQIFYGKIFICLHINNPVLKTCEWKRKWRIATSETVLHQWGSPSCGLEARCTLTSVALFWQWQVFRWLAGISGTKNVGGGGGGGSSLHINNLLIVSTVACHKLISWFNITIKYHMHVYRYEKSIPPPLILLWANGTSHHLRQNQFIPCIGG